MTALRELIERIEAAEEGSRELDIAIVQTLHPDIGPCEPHCSGDQPIFWHDPYHKKPAPRFTSSIDAALSLVPKGLSLGVTIPCARDAVVAAFKPRSQADVWKPLEESVGRGQAATPALALTAAALRARLAMQEPQP